MDVASDDLSQALLEVVRRLAVELNPSSKGMSEVTLDSSLDRDLGFDSLGKMELLVRIEHAFRTTLSEQALATAETPRDLLCAVQAVGVTYRPFFVPEKKIIDARAAATSTPCDAETLIDVLDWHVATHPQRIHVVFTETEEEISYWTLRQEAEAVAAGLQALGLQPQQTVAIMLPTGPDYLYSFFGVLLAGGVPVPIYPPVRLSQIEDHLRRHAGILNNAQVSILVTVPKAKAVAQVLKSQAKGLHHVVTVPELTDSGSAFVMPITQPQDTAFLQYTSGSTGAPKGVVLTHANLLANIRAMGLATRVDSTDVFVSWLPLYHDMGLIGAWLGSLYHAIPLAIMSPLAFLAHPEQWLWAVHRYQGTLSAAPNFAYELCLRKIDDDRLKGMDLSSWRLAFNGAEPVSVDTVSRFQQRFAAYGLRPGAIAPVYGLAESSVGLALSPPGRGLIIDHIKREIFTRSGQAIVAEVGDTDVLRFIACGQPLPGHRIRIVDPSGDELGERREGQLEFQGPSATSGYFRNPEETRRLFHGEWLNSGDLAYMANGDVFPTGRAKDVVIRAGRNIYPYELEDAVGTIPGVRKGCIAVFGSPSPTSGTERLVVLAETRETVADVRETLRAKINARIVDVLGEPPDDIVLAAPHTVLKTSSGKIRRAANRALYEKGDAAGSLIYSAWWPFMRLAWAGARLQLRRIGLLAARSLYAGYVWIVFWALAPLTWLMTALLPRPGSAWVINHAMARLFVRLSGIPFVVRGLENLPSEMPCVLVANHGSYLDGIVLVAALPQPFSFVAKRELGDHFITRVYLKHIGAQFVERFQFEDSVDGVKRLSQTLHAGQSLIFFPEGTFYRTPGLLAFRMGAFVTAAQADAPLIPVTIRGSRTVLRDENWLPRRGPIQITIGVQTLPDGNDWSAAIKLRNSARAEILRLCGERDVLS